MGYPVHVLTVRPEDAHYPHLDPTLEADVAPGIQVHRTTAFNPIAIGKRLLGQHANQVASADLKAKSSFLGQMAMRIRTHLFLPDPRRGWNRAAIRKGAALIEAHGIQTLITTGPPHSSHLIGLALKKRTGIRWMADFRDPWTDVFYYDLLLHSRFSASLDARLERQVMHAADDLITVHDRYRELLERKYPAVQTKLRYLPNGFDQEDFSSEAPNTDEGYFDIVYTGIMAAGYEPDIVAEALAQCTTDRPARLTIVGTAPDSILETFKDRGVEAQCLGMQPHHVANAWQLRADVLLCLIPAIPGAELAHVPGKVYEYLATHTPILNIGPPEGETAHIIRRCGAGETFNRSQAAPIADFIQQVQSGSREQALQVERVAEYSRANQAAQLSRWISG